jgi:hypothetical protein
VTRISIVNGIALQICITIAIGSIGALLYGALFYPNRYIIFLTGFLLPVAIGLQFNKSFTSKVLTSILLIIVSFFSFGAAAVLFSFS